MQFSISEWQSLHGLNSLWHWQDLLREQIDKTSKVIKSQQTSTSQKTHFSGDQVWVLVADAFRDKFPNKQREINTVEQNCKRDFSPAISTKDVAYAIPGRAGQLPSVRVPFDGTIASVLAVAHEFGHAVQFACSRRPFITPIVREMAAFVSTRLFIDYIEKTDVELAISLTSSLANDEKTYLVKNGQQLLRDAEKPGATYQYQHNYPLAWLAAVEAIRWDNKVILWEIFRSHIPANALCAELSPNANFGKNQPLPHYAKIGVAVYAALASLDTICASSINDAYAQLSEITAQKEGFSTYPGVTYASAFGMALELLSASPYHRNITMGDYFRLAILPPLYRGQLRFSLDQDGQALGMISWAQLSQHIMLSVLKNGRALGQNEWASGQEIFINDIVGAQRIKHRLITDFRENVYPDRVLNGVIRNADRSVQRVFQWRRATASGQHNSQIETISA